jgi:hypothetical protein
MARVQILYISNYILEKFQRWIKICKQVPALPTRKHQNAAVLQTSIYWALPHIVLVALRNPIKVYHPN